jgi:hypothetical protein
MSKFLLSVLATQDNKRYKRLERIASQLPQQTLIASPSGFDATTGTYLATLPDGGTIPYKAGNFPTPPDQISVVIGANSSIGFGDWR